jgi:hypothetical protein
MFQTVGLLLLFWMTIMADTNNGAAADAFAASGRFDVPKLPPSDPNNTGVPTIRLGETIRFEEWGPIILNTDGTTRRIDNWDQLTEHEKQVTWRRISKRNEERRMVLLAQQQQQQAANNEEETENKEL